MNENVENALRSADMLVDSLKEAIDETQDLGSLLPLLASAQDILNTLGDLYNETEGE